jgi:hypothetical protein
LDLADLATDIMGFLKANALLAAYLMGAVMVAGTVHKLRPPSSSSKSIVNVGTTKTAKSIVEGVSNSKEAIQQKGLLETLVTCSGYNWASKSGSKTLLCVQKVISELEELQNPQKAKAHVISAVMSTAAVYASMHNAQTVEKCDMFALATMGLVDVGVLFSENIDLAKHAILNTHALGVVLSMQRNTTDLQQTLLECGLQPIVAVIFASCLNLVCKLQIENFTRKTAGALKEEPEQYSTDEEIDSAFRSMINAPGVLDSDKEKCIQILNDINSQDISNESKNKKIRLYLILAKPKSGSVMTHASIFALNG